MVDDDKEQVEAGLMVDDEEEHVEEEVEEMERYDKREGSETGSRLSGLSPFCACALLNSLHNSLCKISGFSLFASEVVSSFTLLLPV